MIDSELLILKNAFSARSNDFIFRKPPSQSQIKKLKELLPGEEKNLVRIYELCDGVGYSYIPPGQVDYYFETIIINLEELLATYDAWFNKSDRDLYPFNYRLFPLFGDGCGNYNCFLAGKGPGRGSVVFFDHEYGYELSYPIAGSLSSYLKLLIDKYPEMYDSKALIKEDSQLQELLKDNDYKAMFVDI